MSFLASLDGKSIAVIGAGVTGQSVVKFLQSRNVNCALFDEKTTTILGIPSQQELSGEFHLAIVSPGWKRSSPLIMELEAAGTELISEVDFAWRIKEELSPRQRWIALTGTNGKTTTIQMVESILKFSGLHARACGNVGVTVVDAVTASEPLDVLALELSSFQIEWSKEAHFAASAILNIAEDHIDWHGSFDGYANAKVELLRHSDLAILNAGDPEVVLRSSAWQGKKIFYSLETPAPGELGLVEEILVDRAFVADTSQAEALAELSDIKPAVPHNVSNALAAAGLARAIGVSLDGVKSGLAAFEIDHHRIEKILEKDEITWINDSKATNPHAALASILSHHSVIWIAGGLAKGASMEELVRRGAPRLKAAILIGRDKQLIAEALAKFAPDIPVHVIESATSASDLMNSVVHKAQDVATAGDNVLLAPACASMDQFTSYAERGDLFAQSVRRLVSM